MRCTHSVQPPRSPCRAAPRASGSRAVRARSCAPCRAGHHAVAAADAGVAIDQHDAVGALGWRRRSGNVHAGRLGAVLAHHRQRKAWRPVLISLISTLRIHCAEVGGASGRCPFSALQAEMHVGMQPTRIWWCRSAGPSALWTSPRAWRPAPPRSGGCRRSSTPPAGRGQAEEFAAARRGPRWIRCSWSGRPTALPAGWRGPKAIDLHGRVGVAADAEIRLRLRHAAAGGAGVAAHAARCRLSRPWRTPRCTVASRWCLSISMCWRRITSGRGHALRAFGRARSPGRPPRRAASAARADTTSHRRRFAAPCYSPRPIWM